MLNDPVLTLDVDWAPDFIIDQVAQLLIENKVKATWFVTHDSAAIDRLKEHKELFELGIHPNMLLGSTHGKTEKQVLTYVKKIVPDAISMRTHGLYQTSDWLAKAYRDHGILIDVSLFLPRAAHLCPHYTKWNYSSLLRIPYFWQGDAEMFDDKPIWTFTDRRLNVEGLRVFTFHPVHVVLNTDRFEKYENLKQLRPVALWDSSFIAGHVHTGTGPRQLFVELVNELAGKGKKIQDFLNNTKES